MKRLTYILFLFFLSTSIRGQNLVGYEYWFDTDFPSKVYTAHMQSDISFDADISTFHQGMHYITFRVKDDKGKWSTPLTQYFYRTSSDNGADNSLTSYEYWLDTDYTKRKNVESTKGVITFDLDTSTLRQGMHYLNLRAKDKLGNWSNLLTQFFYQTSSDNGADNSLISYEYWLDTDYAERKNVESVKGVITFDLDTSTLRQGMHYLNFQAKDKLGNWSNLLTQFFYQTSNDNGADNSLISYEYWLDSDYAERKTVENTNGVITFDLDASSLRQGVHYLNFRAKDKLGNWSNLLTQYLMKTSAVTDNKISNYGYWLNDDLNTLKIVDITPVNPLEWNGFLLDIPPYIIPESMPQKIQLTSSDKENRKGTFAWTDSLQLNLQFKDIADKWSTVEMDTFVHTSQIELEAHPLSINKGESIAKPANRNLAAISIDINKEDSVYWKADQPCFLTLFNAKKELVYTFSGGFRLLPFQHFFQ